MAVVARATSPRTAAGLVCRSVQEVDASGLTLVVVGCSGAVPTLLAGLGALLPVEVTGRAVEATDVRVGYAPAGAGCAAAGGYPPTLARGEEFCVCVTVTVRIPLLPEFVDANTATGQFVVERDRYADT